MVKDEDGAEINGPTCQRQVVLKKRGFLVADLGVLYMPDPATYILARGGYMYKFNETVSLLGMIGIAPVIAGEDDEFAFLADVNLTFWFSKFFIGAGVGLFSSSPSTRFDAIINTGLMLTPNVGIFIEGRCAFDEFDQMNLLGRFGGGIRLIF